MDELKEVPIYWGDILAEMFRKYGNNIINIIINIYNK